MGSRLELCHCIDDNLPNDKKVFLSNEAFCPTMQSTKLKNPTYEIMITNMEDLKLILTFLFLQHVVLCHWCPSSCNVCLMFVGPAFCNKFPMFVEKVPLQIRSHLQYQHNKAAVHFG